EKESVLGLAGLVPKVEKKSVLGLAGLVPKMEKESVLGLVGLVPKVEVKSNPPLISSNWVLSKPLLNEMSLANKEVETKYIFNKISQKDYRISHSFDEENDSLEYVLERKDSTGAIPMKGIPSTVAVTDVIRNLKIDEVAAFYNHLVEFPMLGLHHSVGRRILDEISKGDLVEVRNLNLFRVRQRNLKERQAPFTYPEMFEAPYGFAGHGRYNILGQGELYTCEDRDVALKEVNNIANSDLVYDIVEWKLNESVKMLDLSNSTSPLVQYCSFTKTSQNGQEYFLPNFLAQCAKYHGISGIRYKSIASSNALNYVFFDFEKKWFSSISLTPSVQH
ncbi:RES family NAD+ phosphorylase, partial [Bacillus toyonensis]|uniref:RES family NAD+ phosphorylase n=1 Tax=Bacillus toyonensis TaxID=155322 RepID=UPI0020D239E5